jgi:hypothetical protein
MRMTTVPGDDSSLAGSSYELITGHDDDGWSQDGRDHDQDLTSESVSSLDAQRTDDVHSLADTEQLSDEEYTHVEDADSTPVTSHYRQPDSGRGVQRQLFAESHSSHHYDEQADTDSEDEAASRSSLEYAQESLKTPSIPTPEASKILEKHAASTDESPAAYKKDEPAIYEAAQEHLARLWDMWNGWRLGFQDARQISRVALPWFLFFIGACLVPHFVNVHGPSQDVVPPTTTVYVTTTSIHTTPLLISPTMTPNQPSGQAPRHGESELIPVESSRSKEWIFGSKKPEVTFSTPSSTKLVAHIPPEIKDIWLSEGCIEVLSTREGRNIAMTIIPVTEGLVVRFPRSEAYGVVDVTFRASCKPTLHRVLKVHFGKGILEEVYEMTRHIAQDLTEFVPVAAQEAERHLGNAKRSWDYVADSVGTTALSVRDTVSKGLTTWRDNSQQYMKKAESEIAKATTSLSTYVNALRDEATEYCGDFSEARLRARYAVKLELLNTQIAAKIWWFKVTGRGEEAVDYQRKAKNFLLDKEAAAQQALAKELQDHNEGKFLHHIKALLRGQEYHSECSDEGTTGRRVRKCEWQRTPSRQAKRRTKT